VISARFILSNYPFAEVRVGPMSPMCLTRRQKAILPDPANEP
jgi:hypothetical protein